MGYSHVNLQIERHHSNPHLTQYASKDLYGIWHRSQPSCTAKPVPQTTKFAIELPLQCIIHKLLSFFPFVSLNRFPSQGRHAIWLFYITSSDKSQVWDSVLWKIVAEERRGNSDCLSKIRVTEEWKRRTSCCAWMDGPSRFTFVVEIVIVPRNLGLECSIDSMQNSLFELQKTKQRYKIVIDVCARPVSICTDFKNAPVISECKTN